MFLQSVSLWNLAFYALMVFMATLGLWDVFFGFEENKCSMSYMFEYPEYQVRFGCLTWALRDSGPSRRVSPALAPAPLWSPYANLVSLFFSPWKTLQTAPPPLLPSLTLCVLSALGCQVDDYLKHPPGPPRSCSPDPPPLPGPKSRVQILLTARAHPHPPFLETQPQTLSLNPNPIFLASLP